MNTHAQPLDVAIEIAKEAGEVLLQYFGTELTKKIKTGPEDYATEADEAAEKVILKRLSKEFPNDAIVTEESGAHGSQKAEYTWIVDPLDGTHNFASGSEDFGVMLARARGETIELAVVWNPVKNILATGQLNKGAELNGEVVNLDNAHVDDKPLSVEQDDQERLQDIGYGVTNLGASANTLVTLAGKRRAFVSSNGFIWDFAPPALLLAEAGWKVTDFQGEPFRWTGKLEYGHPGIIAAPTDLHQKLIDILVP